MADAEMPCLVELSSGDRVWVRPIEPEDDEELQTAFRLLSDLSRYRRFFTGMSRLSDSMVRTLTDVDHLDHEALVALPARDSPTIAGVARFIRVPDLQATADLAITVADEWHRRGMGTALLRLLSERASQVGITRFTVDTLAENRAVLALITAAGGVRTGTTGSAITARIEVVDLLRATRGGAPRRGPRADPAPATADHHSP